MAKAYVLGALQGVLSDYLEIDASNFDLSLAVWSGSIILHDVKVRSNNLFRNLNLTGVHGVVKKLEVFIPWTALMSSPVRIEIDGVYLQLKPLDVTTLDKEEAKKRLRAAKQEKIAFADKFLTYHSQHELVDPMDEEESKESKKPKEKQTWTEAWTTKIVDNLEISLKNIHIRYEDSTFLPGGKIFSAGLTLGSFILTTTDENWKSSFVARKNEAIRKLCMTENSGIYWNMQSPSLAGLPFLEWQAAMHKIIFNPPSVSMPDSKDKSSKAALQRAEAAAAAAKAHTFVDNQAGNPRIHPHSPEAMKFVLLPTNKLVIKVVHNDHLLVPGEEPKYDITVVNDDLNVCLDGLQYKQLNAVLDGINAVERSKKPFMYKPQRRPVDEESIRAWWKYACKLVIKRPRYIKLVRLSKSADPSNSFKDSLTTANREEMEELEEKLSLQTIIIFRHLAADEMALDAKKAREARELRNDLIQASTKKQASKQVVVKERTWWDFFAGEPAPEPVEVEKAAPAAPPKGHAHVNMSEDVSISSIISELEEYERSQKSKQTTHSMYMRLILESSATLQLSAYGVPVLHASMSVHALSRTSSQKGTILTLYLRGMKAVDLITPSPTLSNIISVKQVGEAGTAAGDDAHNKTNFTVSFDSTGDRSVLRITSLPVELVCNKICMQYIMHILLPTKPPQEGETAADELRQEKRKRLQTRDALVKATSGGKALVDDEAARRKKSRLGEQDDAFEIIFEAHAPKIIIPEDSSQDKGYMLLDTGYLKVRGFTGEAGMSWDISLNDVNAGMPLRVDDMYKLSQAGNESLYLIKPFDIAMSVQNVDKSMADMSVDVDIKPEIRGELSAHKLQRLLDVIAVASATFGSPPEELPGMAELKALDVTSLVGGQPGAVRRSSLHSVTQALVAQAKQNIAFPPRPPGQGSGTSESRADKEENVAESDIQSLITDLKLQEDSDLDPTRVGLALVLRIPVVALDLMYDEERGCSQVFEVRSLVTRLVNRPHDLSVDFSMGELSIQDSMRSASQRYLAFGGGTQKAGDQEQQDLIAISYVACQTRRSPYFQEHGSKVVVDFANLNLTLDVNTLLHLQPFIIVLLHRESKVPAPPAARANTVDEPNPVNSDIYLSGKPEYMQMTLSMRNLTLDVLRVSQQEDEKVALERAFSLRLLGLHVDLDLKLLTKSLVKIKSVEVLDIREISRDYVIKKVFGPMTLGRDTNTFRTTSSDQLAEFAADDASPVLENDIITVDYHQESKTVAHLDVLVSDACTFGSSDTFLDLSNVVMDNFLAILALLEKPPVDGSQSLRSVSSRGSLIRAVDADSDAEEAMFRDSMGSLSLADLPKPVSPTPCNSSNSKGKANISSPVDFHDREENEPAGFETATIVVTAKVENPRLLLIDDPTKEDSQAIVSRCMCEVHYTRETTTEIATGIKEWRESIHTTVKNLEVYVLKDVRRYYPKAILQPVHVEFNMRREAYNNNVLLSNISVDTGSANLRVTLNDIVLAQSILFRGATMDQQDGDDAGKRQRSNSLTQPPITMGDAESDKGSVSGESVSAADKSPAQMNIILNLGTVSLVAINDFHSQDIPVARMTLDETSLSLVKKGPDFMEGEGDLYASADFYNPSLNVWEPILDRWHPKLTIDTAKIGNVFSIRSAHTMQVTVSGAMLKSFLETSSLLQKVQEGEGVDIEREIVTEVVVENALGAPIELELYDSMSGQLLMTLPPGEALPMPKISDKGSDGRRNGPMHMPSAVNLHFCGAFGEQRASLRNLPLYVHKPRLYHLLPKSHSTALSNSKKHRINSNTNIAASATASTKEESKQAAGKDSNSVVFVEPVEEETFENMRYDPGKQRWATPFIRGDPHEWTDSSCLDKREIDSVTLPRDGHWEWQGRWNVSMAGGVEGVNFDEEGWEYSTAFANFSVSNLGRVFQKNDMARRRRWVRTRILKSAAHGEKLRPMVLHWDVRPLPNGARKVLARSGMQVKNNMPFAVMIVLSYAAWEADVELGPVEEGGLLHVPLFVSCATSMIARPANIPYEWSGSVPCAIETADFSKHLDMFCKGESLATISMRVSMVQTNKSLLITFEPYIIVDNRMPCDLRFRVFTPSGKQQEDTITCGSSCKINYLNAAENTQIKLCMPKTMLWTSAVTIPMASSKANDVLYAELPNSQGHGAFKDKNNGVVMCLRAEMEDGILRIAIYPRSLLIDRTGLGLSVSTNKTNRRGEEMLRHTYSIDGKAAPAVSVKNAKAAAAAKVKASRQSASKIGNVLSIGSAISDPNAEADSEVWHDVTSVLLSELKVDSSNEYLLTKANHAELVYTDRQFLWSHLPEALRGHQYIRLACNDKLRQARQFVEFEVEQACFVIVLVDMRTRGALKWLKEDGFLEMLGHAVARRIHLGQMQELCYTPHGKFFEAGAHVTLRGNFCKEITAMYTVFIVPAPAGNEASSPLEDAFFSQIAFHNSYNRDLANSCWQDGGGGLCLFHSGDDTMAIGVRNGQAWSEELGITMANVTHTESFEVVDTATNEAFQLTYSMRYLPGLFSRTQEIIVMPRFCVVNLMDEELMVVQRGCKDVRTYHPYRADGWHKHDVSLETCVQFRCRSSFWSLGTVDISEIGTSSLHLPRKDDSTAGADAIVLHVEVKVASPGEHCSVVILVWRATVESSTDLSIQNDTDCAITVMQAGVKLDRELSARRLFQICVAPFTSAPFGWADPDLISSVLVTVGTEFNSSVSRDGRTKQRQAEISMLKAGEQLRLPDNTGRQGRAGEVVLSIIALNGGRVLRITRSSKAPGKRGTPERSVTNAAPAPGSSAAAAAAKGFEINFFLSSFGISLVVEQPVRREFLSLYVDGLSVQQLITTGFHSTEVKIQNLQIDNYSEAHMFPVLLHDNKESDKDIAEDAPLVLLSWVRQDAQGDNHMPVYKYGVCRVLPLTIEVDSATVQLLFTDLLNDLKFVTREQTMASTIPNRWADERNRYLVSAERLQLLDVYSSKSKSQLGKMYFENLVIHPMTVTITFVQAPFPRKGSSNPTLGSTFMNVVTSLAGVDKMELRLNSFKVSDALESHDSLRAAFIYKTWQEIKGQLVDVIGSMAAIGAPLGFAKKIGGGVSDLFYEPFKGGILSPQTFLTGLGTGSASLAVNVLSGVSTSLGGIAGSASRGLGNLSGDSEYVRQRALKKQQNKAQNSGFLDGIMDGAESIVSGVGSGLTGLVSRPMEEAQKGGFGGFFKGVGLGLLGAVVKPVMGFTDGISSVASGVTSQVTNETNYVHVRPLRALERSATDPSVLVIGSMNVKAAYAQEFIVKRAKSQQYEDIFLGYTLLNAKTDEAIILSETYIYWRKEKSLWGRTWANVSHCLFFGDSVGIFLYSTGDGGREIVHIPCYTRDQAIALYDTLAKNAFRMGNPCNVIPLASVVNKEWLVDREFREQVLSARGLAPTLDNFLDGYRFGSANEPFKRPNNMAEKELMRAFQASMERPFASWAELDSRVWSMVEAWDASHRALRASRCCAFIVINRSDTPVQISRMQMIRGNHMLLLGSSACGFDPDSRSILAHGVVIFFASAFVPTPIEVGHLKACIECPAFSATVASTQRESSCETKGAFHVGFIEKSVSEWYSKYVLVIS